MIWTAGRLLPDESLAINVRDRTFEHGLGLFETFRTYEGRPLHLRRHLARLTNSAAELGLPLDAATLPGADAVAALLHAEGVRGDALLRLTMSGGGPGFPAAVWLRSAPLPPPHREPGAIVAGTWEVARGDATIRHKCLNYWPRRLAHERAVAAGADEALSVTADGLVWEGSRTNLFVVLGDKLATPHAGGPLLPGIMRGLLLERARALGIVVVEGEFPPEAFRTASEAFLTNSVRGIIPIARLLSVALPAPGPLTIRLREEILNALAAGLDS